MKKIALCMTICIMLAALSATVFAGGSERDKVPMVAYLSPDNDSEVDLTGTQSRTFKWKSAPIPGGGREAYRFKLAKGFGYDTIVSENLGQGVFSTEVPADKFEDGVTYSWYVQQCDASLMVWSRYDTWSFKVIKK